MIFVAERFLLLVLCLLSWEFAISFFSPNPLLVAPPSKVLVRLVEIISGESSVPEFYTHLGITLQELLGAYGLSVVIGLPLGGLLALSRRLEALIQPFLLGFYAVPKIVFFPVCFLIFGTEMMPKVIFGFFLGVFPLILNTQAGIRQVEPAFISLARSFGYGPGATFFKVVLPAAAPTLIAGLRLGLSYCLIGVLVAELLVVSRGIGYLIDWASFQYYTAELYALVLLTMILGWVASMGLNRLEWLWRT
ncbi:MAG: ABC transporter permease subunit [Deltaproteobacteria bacterium]|nr:ABC transporter permease subunit [Deltaproteobacteria bacterium]